MSNFHRARICSDGTPQNTFVLDATGDRLRLGEGCAISEIVFLPIRPGEPVVARVTFVGIGLDVDANVTW